MPQVGFLAIEIWTIAEALLSERLRVYIGRTGSGVLCYSVGILNSSFGANGYVSHLYSVKDMAVNALNFTFRMTNYEGFLLGAYWFVRSLLWGSLLLCLCSVLMNRVTRMKRQTCILSVTAIFGILGGGNFIL